MPTVEDASKLIVDYMAENPGPLDEPRAAAFIKKRLGVSADDAVSLVRQQGVTTAIPVSGYNKKDIEGKRVS